MAVKRPPIFGVEYNFCVSACRYEADAESVLSVLALQPLLDDHSSGNVVVEVDVTHTSS